VSVIAALLVSWKMTVDNVSRLRLIQVPSADLWPVVPALALSAMWAWVKPSVKLVVISIIVVIII